MFDSMLVFRISTTTLVKDISALLEKLYTLLDYMVNKTYAMSTFKAHPYARCFLLFFTSLFHTDVNFFFIFFILAILATCPISIFRKFLEKSLVCSLFNVSA